MNARTGSALPGFHEIVGNRVGDVEVFVRHHALIMVGGVQGFEGFKAGNVMHPVIVGQVVAEVQQLII